VEKSVATKYSSLALAYIGDSVFDLIIKSMILSFGNRPVRVLHWETSCIVEAKCQAKLAEGILPILHEDEHAVYKRARNSKTISPAKNQKLLDYRKATGFEALIGYLYINEDYDRLFELIETAIKKASLLPDDIAQGDKWKKKAVGLLKASML
jgi:ribonuclease-3 family protein